MPGHVAARSGCSQQRKMAHRRLQAIRHFALQGLRRKNRSYPSPVLSGKLFHTTATNWGKSNSCRPLPRSSPSQNLTRKPVFKSVGGRVLRERLCCRNAAHCAAEPWHLAHGIVGWNLTLPLCMTSTDFFLQRRATGFVILAQFPVTRGCWFFYLRHDVYASCCKRCAA